MRRIRLAVLCLFLLLLILPLCACRRNGFSPANPPNPPGLEKYPEDFQCWVVENNEAKTCLTGDEAANLFKDVKNAYERSKQAERFTDKEAGIRLIFCIPGTAPETTIPAYQLPNAQHYGVYTLYPDDTGTYSDVLLTANVGFYSMKKGTYERVRSMIPEGNG